MFFFLVQQEALSLAAQPGVYAAAFVFAALCAFRFFFGSFFFTAGTPPADIRLYFEFIPYASILAVPCLTMGAWGRIEWDETLPVGEGVLVWAKWFASLLGYAAFLAPCVAVPLAASVLAYVDGPAVGASFAMAICFGGAALALGCFLSFVTKNRALAFALTALAIALSNSAHGAPIYAEMPGPLGSLARSLSFAWRFDASGKGIIDTRDIVFFAALTWVFLALTVIGFENRRAGRASPKNRLAAVLIVLVALSCILLSTRIFFRVDVRGDRRFSVSEYGRGLLANAEGRVRITYYLSPDLRNLYPQTRDIEDFLREFASQAGRGKADLTVVNADREDPDMLARAGLAGQDINLSRGNRLEVARAYSGIVIEYLGKTGVIPFILQGDTLEYELDRRILSLLEGGAPLVYVLDGDDSESLTYSYALAWIENAGFAVSPVEAGALPALEEALLSPEGLKAPLVLFGTGGLSREEAAVIEGFAAAGGRVFAAVSPNRVDLLSEWTVTPLERDNLLPALNAWGIDVGKELVLDISCFRLTLESGEGAGRRIEGRNYPPWVTLLPRFTPPHPLTRAFSGMNLFWASPLTLFPDEDTEIAPILCTSDAAWLLRAEPGKEPPFVTNPFLVAPTGGGSGTQGQYTLGAALSGTLPGYYLTDSAVPTRLVCVSGQYFAADLMMEYTSSVQNLDFLVNALIWLRGEDELLPLRQRLPRHILYRVDEETLAAARLPVLVITGLLCPLALPLAGAVFFVKRRRR
jgi:ABC-type uncharacterized transport system involved in gliding motility auxiliary subunit